MMFAVVAWQQSIAGSHRKILPLEHNFPYFIFLFFSDSSFPEK